MTIMLIVVAIVTALAGLTMLSNATLGVGVMALACLFGILARITQAHALHRADRALEPAMTPEREAHLRAAEEHRAQLQSKHVGASDGWTNG